MTEQKVTGPASYFPSIEAKHGRPISEWKEALRAYDDYRTAKPMELVGRLKSEHEMGHGHATALVLHTLDEDGLRKAKK